MHVNATWELRSIRSSLKAYFKPRLTKCHFDKLFCAFLKKCLNILQEDPRSGSSQSLLDSDMLSLEQWDSLSLLRGPRPLKEALWLADSVSEIDSTSWELYPRLALAPFSAKYSGLTRWTPSFHTCWNLALPTWDSALPQTTKWTAWKVYLKDFCTRVKLWILNHTVRFHTS